jgi:uncharacterized protein YjbI with pentapeptide repeats
MSTPTWLKPLLDKHVRIHDMDLRNADVADSDFSGLNADRLDLRSAKLDRVKLQNARLANCSLEGATFEAVECIGASIHMCVLDRTYCASANFVNARLEDCSAVGADFTNANLNATKLSETSFARACMKGIVLNGAEGEGIDFRGADLDGATLVGVRFNDADFRGADLRGANLSNGSFHGADFRGALLDGAVFDGADCNGAVFDANAGPYADTTDASKVSNELGGTVVALLGDSLSELPGVFAEDKDFVKNLTDRLQQAASTLDATSKHSSEAWNQWAESLITLAKDDQAVDLETIMNVLCDGPIELQNLFGLNEDTKSEMLNRVRDLSKVLNSTAHEPPDEWKPILEPLLKRAKAREAVDLKTVIEALSSWLQASPPK